MKQAITRKNLAPLTLGALGVVYGDIGTSPIYALTESLKTAGRTEYDIFGVVSLIFWSLVMVVTFKYLIFVLRADNNGEGGILALFALLPNSIKKAESGSRYLVFMLMLFGTALLFGDGILTPAISVLSATEGLGAINPDLASYSVPVTVLILFVLFAVQFKGTASLGKVFGVVILIWFVSIGTLGYIQVAKEPSVLKALSPFYAVDYIVNHGWHTLIIMASVILAVTGAEALYADLGHFGKTAIRIGWLGVAFPALILNYLGQASLALSESQPGKSLFFALAPNQAITIYLVILATAATIVASQALITGVGSISRQAVQLGLFPRLKILHTSNENEGQIFVPVINALVGVGSIALVVTFKSSGALANAYSFAIAGTMLITTLAFAIVAIQRWKWNKPATYALISVFAFFDVAFFLATVTKFFKGAWIPVGLSVFIVYTMWVWRKGQAVLTKKLEIDSKSWNWVEEQVTENAISIIPGTGIFMSSTSHKAPQALVSQLINLHSIPEKIIVVTVITGDIPVVTAAPIVKKINDRVTRVVIWVGFSQSVQVSEVLSKYVMSKEDEAKAIYYLSERKFSSPESGALRGSEDRYFTILHRNSSNPSQFYGLPMERVITLSIAMDL